MASQALLKLQLARVAAPASLQLKKRSQLYLPYIKTSRQDTDLPFPDFRSVNEDKEREQEQELQIPTDVVPPSPEPDNPMPELPPNHPIEVCNSNNSKS
jgi:hypothetical protein